jgi:hypothetical protein
MADVNGPVVGTTRPVRRHARIARRARRRGRFASVGMVLVLAAGLVPVGAGPASAASTPIMGPQVLNATQLANYYRASGRSPHPDVTVSIDTLARYFIEEGAREGIRGDIAFAQAIHETGWFQYTGDVPAHYNNFAGIGATGGVPGNKFTTARSGVRAQIHHLRAYADPNMVVYYRDPNPSPPVLSNPPVKPENEPGARFVLHFNRTTFGSAPTWERLTGTWAADPTYHEKVLGRWHDMLQFAGHRLEDAIPITGDWNGNGRDTLGWFLNGRVYLTNRTDRLSADIIYSYGRRGDIPVVGDWNGNGRDTVSVIRDGRWYIRNELASGAADLSFVYGRITSGDYALAGDWNRNGRDTPGIVRDGDWHLRNELAGGKADIVFRYGRVRQGDIPLTGDWNGDRRDTPAIVRDGEWHVRLVNRGGAADAVFRYGRATDTPVAGDWNANGFDTPGVVRGTFWYLRNALSSGSAHITTQYNAQ